MKIIKRIDDHVVIYSGEDLTLGDTCATGGSVALGDVEVDGVFQQHIAPEWRDFGTTTANAVLVDGVTLPQPWCGGAYTHDDSNGFAVHDAALIASLSPSPAAVAASIEQRIDADLLDATAQAWGYSDSTRLASYYNSGNSQWQAEARAFVSWRDAVWEKAASIQGAWQAGQPIPTYESVLAQLPTVTRPTVATPTPAPSAAPAPGTP